MTAKYLPVLLVLASAGAGQAAEKIRYDDLWARLAPFGMELDHRVFKVIMLDGKVHRGGRLLPERDHARIFAKRSFEDLPREQIARIEIRRSWRFVHHIVEALKFPLLAAALTCAAPVSEDVSYLCAIPMIPVFSPAWAYAAVTAPFFFASDVAALLIPPKVYEIMH
jgi:hypothetical protein